jgi:hypothetical protein
MAIDTPTSARTRPEAPDVWVATNGALRRMRRMRRGPEDRVFVGARRDGSRIPPVRYYVVLLRLGSPRFEPVTAHRS